MSITPQDILTLAKSVDLGAPCEAEVRSAISRAYYSAYHCAQSVFPPDKEFARRARTGVHESYIDQLMQAVPETTERLLAVKLKTMKERRVIADYRIGDDVRPFTAARQNQEADEVFSLLSIASTAENPVPSQQNKPRPPTLTRLK